MPQMAGSKSYEFHPIGSKHFTSVSPSVRLRWRRILKTLIMCGAQPGDVPRDKAHPKGSKGPRPEPASMIAGAVSP